MDNAILQDIRNIDTAGVEFDEPELLLRNVKWLLEIDYEKKSTRIFSLHSSENATPERVWNGRAARFSLPTLPISMLEAVEETLKPHFEALYAEYSSSIRNSNVVGVLTEEGVRLTMDIERAIAEGLSDFWGVAEHNDHLVDPGVLTSIDEIYAATPYDDEKLLAMHQDDVSVQRMAAWMLDDYGVWMEKEGRIWLDDPLSTVERLVEDRLMELEGDE